VKKLFLCTCNKTINKTVDFSKIEKELEKTFDAIETLDSLCLEEGLVRLRQSVSNDDQVAIGACSSQIIEIPVKQKLKNNLISFVPVREHIAWVHPDDSKSATNKTIVLLTDAALQLDYMESPAEFNDNMIERVLIIGGGIAGLKAASDLRMLGIGVTLLEPPGQNDEKYYEDSLFMSDHDTLVQMLKTLHGSLAGVEQAQGHVQQITGQMGSYTITWKDSAGNLTTQDYGAIIVATGTRQYLPGIAKKCRFGKSERVLTLRNLVTGLGKKGAKKISTILIMTDTDAEMSPVEGSHLLRMAEMLASQGNTVFVAHSDIRTDDENLYRKARDSGVIFVRGALKKVKENDSGLTCLIENRLESMVRELTVDTIAISQMVGPASDTARLAAVLNIEYDDMGFIKTRYSKMKPVQTSRRGIFIAGGAKTPMSLPQALTSAQNAVLEAFKVVRSPLKRSGWTPVIDDERCDVCKACITACPNDALRLLEGKVIHIPVHCEFCGICVSSCPTRAIEFQSHSKESWFSRLEEIAKTHNRLERDRPFTLVYACSECANASIDQAGFTGKGYPSGTYVLQFPCAGMVSPIEILKGLVVGAERVIVAHCPLGGCHHQSGDRLSELVVQLTREMLREIGQDPDRVRATYMIAAMPEKMQKEVGPHG
jgi:heterodisulfide reductase subunit A-like polyferredoxin/coenzyme F420-reducing hydrogenase delta subunit